MSKAQMLEDIEMLTCPICKTERSLWLQEEGMDHESYECQKCETEVIMEMERIVSSVTLYNPETDEEILLKEGK